MRARLVPALLVIPLVGVPTAAILVMTAETRGGSLPLAQGAAGGFHPVAGSFVPDDTRLDECGDRYSCLEQAFGNVAYAEGARRALALFERESPRNEHVERNCHRIVHVIGSATFARNDGNFARTFAEGTSTCASGFYHGILERAFVGLESREQLERVARGLCLDAGIRRRGFLDYQCHHGLGHGFMIQTGYHLPTALSLCSRLGTGWDRVTCTSGAFMENVSTRFGYRSRWLDEDDLHYPCNDVAPVHRRSCYLRITTWILQVEQNDFARAAQHCRAAPRAWIATCFRGYGRDAVVDGRYTNFGRVHALCRHARGFADECYFGAARTFADGQGLAGAKRASRFCAGVRATHRDRCVAGYGIVVGLVSPDASTRARTCAALAGRSADACAAAAEAEVDPAGRDAWG